MEQGIFLPFSSLIASMLLFKRHITSLEIVNFISMLSSENIFIDDEFDDIDSLLLCVNCFNYAYFDIKEIFNYDSVLNNEKTVREFLNELASKEIIDLIERGKCSNFFNYDVLDKEVVLKRKVKRKNFITF